MSLAKFIKRNWLDAAAFVVIGVIFGVPFLFILLTASKTSDRSGTI